MALVPAVLTLNVSPCSFSVAVDTRELSPTGRKSIPYPNYYSSPRPGRLALCCLCPLMSLLDYSSLLVQVFDRRKAQDGSLSTPLSITCTPMTHTGRSCSTPCKVSAAS